MYIFAGKQKSFLMRCLIIGNGGREHALGWRIALDIGKDNVFFAQGNAGTALTGKNIDINPLNFDEISKFIDEKNIDLVIVGPEAPLVAGITDFLTRKHKNLTVIGPEKAAARLEASKAFAKNFMIDNNIPTAKYKSFSKTEAAAATDYLKSLKPPYVLKADGLAAGKGVFITEDLNDAIKELKNIFAGKFGDAGNKVVIEEFLQGTEFSVFIITNGTDYLILPTAKDYKRAKDGDKGLNTGGMGAVSPVNFADKLLKKVENKIIKPTLNGLKNYTLKYVGFLYFGLINVNGEPYVLEYNVRMGDPETQAVIPHIQGNFYQFLKNINNPDFGGIKLTSDDLCNVGVVLASEGYPEKYEKGFEISFDETGKDILIFHAGTAQKNNKIITNGGRVLTVVAKGKNINEARKKAYNAVDKIHFENKYFRKDIALDIIN